MAKNETELTSKILPAVKTPLMLFALFILVEQGIFLGLIGRASPSDLTKLVFGHLGLTLVCLIAFVIVAVVRPQLLSPSYHQLPAALNDRPKPLPNSAFIATAMSAFKTAGQPDGYKANRDLILKLIKLLKSECNMENIYSACEAVEDIDSFDSPGASLKSDFRLIQEREYFILLYPHGCSSRSVLVEAGIALTMNKKCIYLINDEDDLPFMLQGAPNVTPNVKFLKFKDADDLLKRVKVDHKWICDFSVSPLSTT